MSCPPSTNASGLLGYWELGNNANDATAYGNNGVIEGAIVSTDTPVFNCNNQNLCTTTDSIYVEILDVDIVQNDTNICQGDSIELSVVSSSNDLATLGGSLNSGLVGYYPFNGNANDESGNGNNGTVNGATLTTDRFGNVNEAYSFDGYNNITVPHNSNLNLVGDLTLSAWFYSINPPQVPNSHTIISKRSDVSFNTFPYLLAINYQINNPSYYKTPIFSTASSNNYQYLNSNSMITNGVWNHLVSTINGDSLKIYLNGIEILDTLVDNSKRANNNADLLIGSGARLDLPAEQFEGKLDELRIYNRSMDNQEVLELYNSQSNHSYTWSNGETTETIHVAPTQTTTYYVTASNGISSCQDSVTVNVLPTSALAIDTAVCDSMFFAGNNIATSGLYYDTLQ